MADNEPPTNLELMKDTNSSYEQVTMFRMRITFYGDLTA